MYMPNTITIRRLARPAFAAAVLAAVWAVAAPAGQAHAQAVTADRSGASVAKPPRPKLVEDGTFEFKKISYKIPYYFEEGRGHRDEDAHVFYLPPFLLETNPDGDIRSVYDDGKGRLTLWIRPAADHAELENAARDKLKETAKKSSDSEKLAEGSRPYRIGPLNPKAIYLSMDNLRPGQRVQSQPLTGVATINASSSNPSIAVHFFIDRERANDLIDGLHTNKDQFTIRYEFDGVSDATCEASAKTGFEHQIASQIETRGMGGNNSVTRNQAAEIVQALWNQDAFEVRCADRTASRDVMTVLMNLLDRQGLSEPVGLDELEKLTALGFDPDDFKADLTSAIKKKEYGKVREIFRNVFNKVSKQSNSKTVESEKEIGLGARIFRIVAGSVTEIVNTIYGDAGSEEEAEVRKNHLDVIVEMGRELGFEGRKTNSKTVNVYRKRDLLAVWNKDLKVEYTLTEGVPGKPAILMTAGDRIPTLPLDDRKSLETWKNDTITELEKKLIKIQICNYTLNVKPSNRLQLFDLGKSSQMVFFVNFWEDTCFRSNTVLTRVSTVNSNWALGIQIAPSEQGPMGTTALNRQFACGVGIRNKVYFSLAFANGSYAGRYDAQYTNVEAKQIQPTHCYGGSQ